MRAQLFIVLFACLALAYAGDFSSAQYQAKTSNQKMDLLWKAIKEDTTPYGWYSALSFAGLFFEKMKPTFEAERDDMPDGHKKYIHSVGSVAQAEFIAEPSSRYTGVFEGAKNVLIRISTAKAATAGGKPEDSFLPGLAIKFLRNGVPSANLVAMKGLDASDSWNIFKYDWNHHIAEPCSFALKLAAKKFAEATPYVGRIGLRTFAEYKEDGSKVSKINVPFKIIFRPNAAVKNMFPDSYQDEFTKQLATIKAGTPLYDIYAAPKPHADAVKIGTIKTKSAFTTSKFGDKDLFFQHNYIEEDLEVHPNWLEDIKVDPPIPSKLV